LDVKLGVGAFMPDLEQAQQLAELLVSIAGLAGRKAVALLSDMNQPLGNAVGNAIEVKEAITTLQGGGPADFREHCLEVAGHILNLGGKTTGEQEGRRIAEQALTGGRGWEMFKRLVKAQGGDVAYVEDPALLPAARLVETVPAPRSGYLSAINARIIGQTSVLLGGGRAKKGDPIDHAVGVIVHHKVGDHVDEGESLFTLHANDSKRLEDARQRLLEAHTWSEEPVQPLPLFYGVVKAQANP
jgi:pyrimidine-nucleoside phosphorylase